MRGEIDLALVTERGNHTAGFGVECNQTPPRVDEDATLAPITPRRHATMHKPGPIARLAVHLPRLRIERPQFLTGRRIQRDHAIERGREIERVVDGEWCRLKISRACSFLSVARRNRRFVAAPGVRDDQLRDVAAIDIGQRRVLESPGIVAVRGPVNRLRARRRTSSRCTRTLRAGRCCGHCHRQADHREMYCCALHGSSRQSETVKPSRGCACPASMSR